MTKDATKTKVRIGMSMDAKVQLVISADVELQQGIARTLK